MAQRPPRVVAELGRPETPAETAQRKAASSAAYRSSQTVRNLIAALLVTVAIVAIIVLMVPRASAPPREPLDVAAIAADVASTQGRAIVAPEMGELWIVNRAQLDGTGGLTVWTVVLAEDDEAPDAGTQFLRVEQGLDADPSWPARVIPGAMADGTTVIDGVEWITYAVPSSSRSENISVALSTVAGPDTVLIYGAADDDSVQRAATSIADEIRALRGEETP